MSTRPSVPAWADSSAQPAAPSPYQLNLLYTGEDWYNAQGGQREGNSYMNNVDASLRVDTDKAFGWTGGQFYLEGWFENPVSTGNKYVGAVDQQSPIDTAVNDSSHSASNIWRLYQVYYDQNFAKTGTDVLFGIHDLETEFSTTKPMSLFLSKDLTWNTAFDQAGTMPENGNVGPGNYPYTPLTLRVRQELSKDWSIQGAVANGAGGNVNHQQSNEINVSPTIGAMGIGELDYQPTKTTKVMVGAWGLTGKLPAFNQTTSTGDQRLVYDQGGG